MGWEQENELGRGRVVELVRQMLKDDNMPKFNLALLELVNDPRDGVSIGALFEIAERLKHHEAHMILMQLEPLNLEKAKQSESCLI
ncbi:hypothetical protein [Agrobacterium pusense]|uniref:hypothetical protein n=1 Tax=Agrobacterium pusense TaxID=648995 RepID=UPI000D1A74DD|nr:hypothetical protein [Agrobacterium pusense]